MAQLLGTLLRLHGAVMRRLQQMCVQRQIALNLLESPNSVRQFLLRWRSVIDNKEGRSGSKRESSPISVLTPSRQSTLGLAWERERDASEPDKPRLRPIDSLPNAPTPSAKPSFVYSSAVATSMPVHAPDKVEYHSRPCLQCNDAFETLNARMGKIEDALTTLLGKLDERAMA